MQGTGYTTSYRYSKLGVGAADTYLGELQFSSMFITGISFVRFVDVRVLSQAIISCRMILHNIIAWRVTLKMCQRKP